MADQQRQPQSDEHRENISRRRFMQGVMAASAAAAAATLSAKAIAGGLGRASSAPVESFAGFTEGQRHILTAVLDRIVPAEGVMPGAGDVGIAGFIEHVLKEGPVLRQPILGLMHALPGDGTVGSLTGSEIDAWLHGIEHEQPESFNLFLQAAYTGYYGHPDVLAVLDWERGDVPSGETAFFDATVLEEVRKRGPIYRNV